MLRFSKKKEAVVARPLNPEIDKRKIPFLPQIGLMICAAACFAPGTMLFADDEASAQAAAASEPQIVLTGDTSEPVLSTFVLGEPIELRFSAEGLTAGEELTLDLRILDEHDNVLSSEQLPVTANEQGQWQGRLNMPSGRLGFRRVEAELSNGVKLQKLGTRPEGFLTYAIVPDPDQRPDYGPERSRFGMQGGFGREWGNRSLQLLGARWVLDGSFEWRRQEPERAGQFAVKLAEDPQQPASPQPWRTYALPTLMAAPQWAVIPETFSYMTGTLKPEHEESWQEYCRLAVQAFMQKYPNQSPRVYQITWEPQPPWGFKGTLSDLVRIYELAYPVIHETDPEAIVAGPTTGLQHRQELQDTAELFALGLGDYLDAYTAHPYFSMTSEQDGMIQRMRTLKEILATVDKGLPMYGTEQGQTTYERRDLELQHAQALLRQNLITLGEGFEWNMAFYIVDYHLANQSGYGYYYNLVDEVPWGPAKAGPRPIAPAYAFQSLLLDGTGPVRPINWLGDTAWGYAFEREDEVFLALWDYGDQPREVRLPVGADQITVYDWMGNEREVQVENGQSISLTIGPEVIYVAGVSADLWGSAGRKTLDLTQDELVVAPGQEVTIEAKLTAPADRAMSGMLIIQPDARLGIERREVPVSLAAGEQEGITARIDVPADAELDNYAVQISIEDDSQTLALAGKWLRVVSPVKVERVRPLVQDDGTPALRVVLHDYQGGGQQGQMRINIPSLPGQTRSVPFALNPGETRTEIIPLEDADLNPVRNYMVELTTLPTPERRYDETHLVNWFAPPRMANPPMIDGDLSDWSGIEAHDLPALRGWKDPEDLSAGVRLAWDEDALSVAVEVIDDVFVQNWNSHNTGRGDSIQLSFNLDPDREPVMSGNELADTGLRPRTSRIVVATTRDGVQVYRHATYNADVLPTGLVSAEQISADIRQEGQTTTYELAIPWTAMGGDTVTPGQLIGLNLEVNDLDVEDWHKRVGVPMFKGDGEGGRSGLIQLGNSD